jgi:hypothetical protein
MPTAVARDATPATRVPKVSVVAAVTVLALVNASATRLDGSS